MMNKHTCPLCHGNGKLTYFTPRESSMSGFAEMEMKTVPCETCHGTGEVDDTVHAKWETLRQEIREAFSTMSGVQYIKEQIRQYDSTPLAILTEDFPVNIGSEVRTIIFTLTDMQLEALKSGETLINSGYTMYNYVIGYQPNDAP